MAGFPTTMIEAPQSFVVRAECEKAASDNGFRRALGEREGWAAYASTTVPGTIHLAAGGPHGPWLLALDHRGVIGELAVQPASVAGPGETRFAFARLSDLYAALSRVYALSASLPDAPLRTFRQQIEGLPRTTEIERLLVQRIGQDIFRAGLLEYWQGRCPLTGISDPALLRASHILPWKDCGSDEERLDVRNGLLLSALWDAAFDRGLVTFDDEGAPIFSPSLSDEAKAHLTWREPLPLSEAQRHRLRWHREHVFVTTAAS